MAQMGFVSGTKKAAAEEAAPTSFPRALVSVTMDDGWATQYTEGLPRLNAKGIKATAYIVTSYIEGGYAGYMTLGNLQTFKAGGHEIASHTVTHPDLTTLDSTQLNAELQNSKAWLEAPARNLGPIYNFAPPYGAYNNTTITATMNYYLSSRDGWSEAWENTNTLANFDARHIHIKQVLPTTTATEVAGWMDDAKTHNAWVVLMYHRIEVLNPSDPSYLYSIAPSGSANGADFEAHMNAIAASGVASVTVKQALDEIYPEVTVSAPSGNGTVTPATQRVKYGNAANITITPAVGYEISEIKDNGVNATITNPNGMVYSISSVTEKHDVVVAFSLKEYTITATAGPNGSITPSGEVKVNHGSDQKFTITPATHYRIADVKVDGVSLTNLPAEGAYEYTFNNVTQDHTIQATFAQIVRTITATAGPNGSIDPSGEVSVIDGQNQKFTITPAAHYHISQVLVDGNPVPNLPETGAYEYTFTNVTENHTIHATFAITEWTITATAGPNGIITPAGIITVVDGDDQKFDVTPAEHYAIKDVIVDNVSMGPLSTYTFTNVTANHTITASFGKKVHSITASAGPHGSISPVGNVGVEDGDDLKFTITPDTGYHIEDVLVDGASVGAVPEYTFFNISDNHTIHASFAIDTFVIAASVDPAGSGEVSGAGIYDYGQTVNLVATPATGYHFVNWTEGQTVVSTEAAYSFTATANRSLVAHFALNSYTIAATVEGGNGSVSPTSQSVEYGGTASISMSPDSGYVIGSIIDNGLTVQEPYTNPYVIENVTEDHTVVVTFEPEASPHETSYAFYFAEGYTGAGFDVWLCLMNPGNDPTTAHITYMFKDGTTQTQDVPIGGTTRETVDVNAAVGAGKDVSIMVTSDAPIVAERPMYFNYKGSWTGGHDVVGFSPGI